MMAASAGPGTDRAGKRGQGAGDRRSGQLPEPDGGQHFRARAPRPSPFWAWSASTGRYTGPFPTASRRGRCCAPPPSPRAACWCGEPVRSICALCCSSWRRRAWAFGRPTRASALSGSAVSPFEVRTLAYPGFPTDMQAPDDRGGLALPRAKPDPRNRVREPFHARGLNSAVWAGVSGWRTTWRWWRAAIRCGEPACAVPISGRAQR